MGTALSPEQVAQLGRMADRVVVVFDGDDAGQRAARKAVPLFVEANVDGRIARLPSGRGSGRLRASGRAPTRSENWWMAHGPCVEQLIDDLARATEATIPDRMKALEEVGARAGAGAGSDRAGALRGPAGEHVRVDALSRSGASCAAPLRRADGAPARPPGRGCRRRPSGRRRRRRAAPRSLPRDELEALVLLVSKPELARLAGRPPGGGAAHRPRAEAAGRGPPSSSWPTADGLESPPGSTAEPRTCARRSPPP